MHTHGDSIRWLISHYRRLLSAICIVKADRHGKQVFYAAADQHISGVLAAMLELIAEPCQETD